MRSARYVPALLSSFSPSFPSVPPFPFSFRLVFKHPSPVSLFPHCLQVVIACDGVFRGTKLIPLFQTVDNAIKICKVLEGAREGERARGEFLVLTLGQNVSTQLLPSLFPAQTGAGPCHRAHLGLGAPWRRSRRRTSYAWPRRYVRLALSSFHTNSHNFVSLNTFLRSFLPKSGGMKLYPRPLQPVL